MEPFLIPSGPLWRENFTDHDPPRLVRYFGGRWTVTWERPFQAKASIFGAGERWADGAWVMREDRGTWLGRLWWKHIVMGYAHFKFTVFRRGYERLRRRAEDYPHGGARLDWRCENKRTGEPWHTGDPNPPYGDLISIAVFDKQPGDGQDRVAARYYGRFQATV